MAQRDKLDPQKREENLARTLATTREATAPLAGAPLYVVWPENTYPFLSEQPSVGRALANTLPGGATLITGSVRAYPKAGSDTDFSFGNAVQVFGPVSGRSAPLSAVYDKHHLVPFGEYLPLEGLFRATGLASMSPVGAGGFTPGPGPAVLGVGPAPFAPLVCYEDVFPGELYPRGARPDWLVVVTNDAWFGDGAGPAQHLAIARMRAIESALPLARSANTGISALIGPQGRVLRALPLYEPGVIVAPLPPPGPAHALRPLGRSRLGACCYCWLYSRPGLRDLLVEVDVVTSLHPVVSAPSRETGARAWRPGDPRARTRTRRPSRTRGPLTPWTSTSAPACACAG